MRRTIRALRAPPTPPSGFTLVEMIITVVILGILTTGAFPVAKLAIQRTKEQELRTGLRQIREAIDAYKQAFDEGRVVRQADSSGYPPSLDALVTGTDDVKTPQKKQIFFLRKLPRNPFAAEELSAEGTWGKRSYESPYDSPKEGKDVFDVYPLAGGKGLNGIPDRDW